MKSRRNRTITATKYDRQLKKKSWKSPRGAWIGKVEIVGDIVTFDTTHLWDALRNHLSHPQC